jgi:hypothetical protein
LPGCTRTMPFLSGAMTLCTVMVLPDDSRSGQADSTDKLNA